MHHLITIPMSHYNERARWALDLCGVPYEEKGYLPLLHFAPVFKNAVGRSGKADRASSPFSTPLLITPNGRRIHDSGLIVRYAVEHFGGSLDIGAEASSLAQTFHDNLGPKTRLLTYHWLLPERDLMGWIAHENVGPVQTRIVISAYPLFRRAMIRALGVIPSRADRALEEVRTIFDEVSDQIRDRRFLVGESFSLADLTFASLASLALGVSHDEGYGAVMPSLERYPEPARSVMRELRATEAGKFALRMYAEERRRVTRGSTGRMAPTTIEHPAITKITRCGGC
jgi:glutathione S-transferase